MAMQLFFWQSIDILFSKAHEIKAKKYHKKKNEVNNCWDLLKMIVGCFVCNWRYLTSKFVQNNQFKSSSKILWAFITALLFSWVHPTCYNVPYS